MIPASMLNISLNELTSTIAKSKNGLLKSARSAYREKLEYLQERNYGFGRRQVYYEGWSSRALLRVLSCLAYNR